MYENKRGVIYPSGDVFYLGVDSDNREIDIERRKRNMPIPREGYKKDYYKKNRERILIMQKRHKSYWPSHYNKYTIRLWQLTHPEKVRLTYLVRRSKKKGLIEKYTSDEWMMKRDNTNGICPGFRCKSHFVGIENLTIDHIIPIASAPKGFIYTIEDIQPLCASCNSRKNNKVMK